MSTPWIAAFAALWLTVFVVAYLVLGMLRRLLPVVTEAEGILADARRRARTGGLDVGARIPDFDVMTVSGERLTRSDLIGSRTMLLFLGPTCPACERFNHDLIEGVVPDLDARLVVVTSDAEQALSLYGVPLAVVADSERVLAGALQSDRTPHAFVVDPDARVAAVGSPNAWDQLRDLLDDTRQGGGDAHAVTASAV